MSDLDQATPGIPVRHAARFGWPLPALAGGSTDAEDTAAATEGGTGDTPDPGTATDQQTEQQNWEARYKEAQAWGTRVAQEKAQLEQQAQLVAALQSDDPDLRRQAFEALGLELADEAIEDDGTPYLTLEEWQQFQQQQAQERAQAQAQAQQEAAMAQIDDTFQNHQGLKGLDQEDRDWVIARALALDPKEVTQQGVRMPDIRAAHEKFVAWETERQKKWAATKRTTHRVSPVGEAGTQVPDLDDRDARQQWMEQRFADLQADS